MTNKEWLGTLSAEKIYTVWDFLLHQYGKRYTDSKAAIIQWLDAQHHEGFGAWFGSLEDGGF